MGEVKATLGIWTADGSDLRHVEMQVDTGASYSQLPGKLLRDLGWSPDQPPLPAGLADGSRTFVELGEVRIQYDGIDLTRLFIFGEDHCPKLLGSDTLQGLRLGVDPVNHRLINLMVYR